MFIASISQMIKVLIKGLIFSFQFNNFCQIHEWVYFEWSVQNLKSIKRMNNSSALVPNHKTLTINQVFSERQERYIIVDKHGVSCVPNNLSAHLSKYKMS